MGTEITLAIFGLSSMDEATLGTMLHWSLRYQALFTGLLWWILTPIVFSIILFVSLYIISIGLSEYLNPRTRLR
jgi:peptide/nickel transport system permease protein